MTIDDPELQRFLTLIGYKNEKQKNLCLETCLVTDEGWDGDNLDIIIATLEKDFGVDCTHLNSKAYAYSEGKILVGASLLNRLKRILGIRHREFKPLTLGMIADAIHKKKWPDLFD